MFIDFFYELRRRKVPVATQDWMLLCQALELGLHDSSLDGFYHLARTVCVKDLAHYDGFDAAFLTIFKGIELQSIQLVEEMKAWLGDPKQLEGLTPEQRALLKSLSPEELIRMYRERLAEQKKRHEGGNRWIGSGGTSPFGTGGFNPTGMRVGDGGGKSAMALAAERRFADYRNDVVLDVRRIDVALRLLRDLGRDGAPEELALEDTIDRTAKNAGDLEVVMRPPRRNRAKVLLLMDVGGSMDPYSHLVARLLTAASRAGRFARFRAFYFHNCVYDQVFTEARFRDMVPVADLLSGSDRDERLIIVGDAAMHPAELLEPGGSLWYGARTSGETAGIDWMRMIADHFRRTVWLNPDDERRWAGTVRILGGLFPMYPLTISGIEQAVRKLTRGT